MRPSPPGPRPPLTRQVAICQTQPPCGWPGAGSQKQGLWPWGHQVCLQQTQNLGTSKPQPLGLACSSRDTIGTQHPGQEGWHPLAKPCVPSCGFPWTPPREGQSWQVPLNSCLPTPPQQTPEPSGPAQGQHSHRNVSPPPASGHVGHELGWETPRLLGHRQGNRQGISVSLQITGWALKLRPGPLILPGEKPKPPPPRWQNPAAPQGGVGSGSPHCPASRPPGTPCAEPARLELWVSLCEQRS